MKTPVDIFTNLINQSGTSNDNTHQLRHYNFWKKSTSDSYKRMTEDELRVSMENYIQSRLPATDEIDIKSILMAYTTLSLALLASTLKLLASQRIQVNDTIQGYFISSSDAARLSHLLDNYRPLQFLFSASVSVYGLDSPEKYHRFCYYAKDRAKIFSLNFHPFFPRDKHFYDISENATLVQITEDWLALELSDQPSKNSNYISLAEAAECCAVKLDEMLTWLKENPNLFAMQDGRVYVQRNLINRTLSQLRSMCPLSLLVKDVVAQRSRINQSDVLNKIKQQFVFATPKWLVSGKELLGKETGEKYYKLEDEKHARQYLEDICDEFAVYGVAQLKKVTGLSAPKLKELSISGHINATNKNGNYYISAVEIQRVTELSKKYIVLDDVISMIINITDSKFQINKTRDRGNFLAFTNGNKWWGIPTYDSNSFSLNAKAFGLFLEQKDVDSLKKHIRLWLSGYDKSNHEKSLLLLADNKYRYPKTCKAVQAYINSHDNHYTFDDQSVVDTLDLLFKVMPAELEKLSEDEIESAIISRFKSASLRSCAILSDLLFNCEYTQKQYTFDKTGYHPDTSAYSIDAFATMVYTTLNSKAWEKECLLQKAIENKRYADLWLYVSLHIFCAWRTPDLVRVLRPSLKYPPQETLKLISEGVYPEEDARYVSQYFIAQIQALALRPNKTLQISNVPILYFYCPEDCLIPFGIILSIATAHYSLKNDTDLINKATDIHSIRTFFGDKFADACGNSRFSTRRANKALMQSVELLASDTDGGSPVPYVLASVMRSHKGGYGEIAKTTAKYLKDATFSGFTPQFIAYQMLERGVCSFAVDILLKRCYGEDYKSLSTPEQTKLIKSVGISVASLDRMLRTIQDAEDDAIAVVQEIVSDESPEAAQATLKSIIFGHAVGKDAQSLCLWKAAGQKCSDPNRLACLGCRYEIKTKALLLRYLKNHIQLQSEINNPSIAKIKVEVDRRQYALKKSVFPAIAEIVSHLKEQLGSDDLLAYKKIVEEVMVNGDHYKSTM